MKRIGIAASRIAKGSLLFYNICVLLISFLLSLLIFFLSGFTLIVGLGLITLVTRGFMAIEPGTGFSAILTTCMGALAVVVSIFYLAALVINIKIRK